MKQSVLPLGVDGRNGIVPPISTDRLSYSQIPAGSCDLAEPFRLRRRAHGSSVAPRMMDAAVVISPQQPSQNDGRLRLVSREGMKGKELQNVEECPEFCALIGTEISLI